MSESPNIEYKQTWSNECNARLARFTKRHTPKIKNFLQLYDAVAAGMVAVGKQKSGTICPAFAMTAFRLRNSELVNNYHPTICIVHSNNSST